MTDLSNDKLCAVVGGLSISGSIISAFTSGIKTILDVGRSFGTAIRRIVEGNLCQI